MEGSTVHQGEVRELEYSRIILYVDRDGYVLMHLSKLTKLHTKRVTDTICNLYFKFLRLYFFRVVLGS